MKTIHTHLLNPGNSAEETDCPCVHHSMQPSLFGALAQTLLLWHSSLAGQNFYWQVECVKWKRTEPTWTWSYLWTGQRKPLTAQPTHKGRRKTLWDFYQLHRAIHPVCTLAWAMHSVQSLSLQHCFPVRQRLLLPKRVYIHRENRISSNSNLRASAPAPWAPILPPVEL